MFETKIKLSWKWQKETDNGIPRKRITYLDKKRTKNKQQKTRSNLKI